MLVESILITAVVSGAFTNSAQAGIFLGQVVDRATQALSQVKDFFYELNIQRQGYEKLIDADRV